MFLLPSLLIFIPICTGGLNSGVLRYSDRIYEHKNEQTET